MKKLIISIIAVVIVGAVGAIAVLLNNTNDDKTTDTETASNNQSAINNGENNMNNNKTLVVYFSRTGENYGVGEISVGNTAMMAEYIAEYTGADKFEIVPVKPYPNNYQETVDIATEERNSNARPEYQGDIDISDYDTIFLGYPIWWGDMPMIVYSFLEKHDFSDKTVIPFNTHEGSGSSGTYQKIQGILSGAEVRDGLALTGSTARTENGKAQTLDWLRNLGF